MNFQAIQALYAACCGGVTDIEQDYIQLTEARRSHERLTVALARGTEEDMDALCVDSEAAHEEQGFVNGFRMGVRLMTECTMSAPLDIWHDQERGRVAPVAPPSGRGCA